MNLISRIWRGTPLLLLLVLVTACSSAPAEDASPTPEPAPVEQQATQAPAATQALEEATAEDAPVVDVRPTPKQGLVATDPTTVELASGGPKLVEFFAFW